jgi:IPT/TIG domain
VHVPPGHAPGNVDLLATAVNGAVTRLPGAVEIVPPAPVVTSVAPVAIDQGGGAVLLVEGSGFRPDAHVALGDRIYAEGAGLEWLDDQTLRVITAVTHLGLHDLVVVDVSGVEGRLADAVQVAVLPSIESVFPLAGSAAGGTEILLHGENYEPGLQVRIDGLPADVIELLGAESVRVRTAPGKPGGPYLLELELPGGSVATGLFAYAAEADPELAAIEPTLGAAGTFVTVHGAHFTPDMTIVFGADEGTGLGGVEAEDVSFVDEHTLIAYVPALSAGPQSVMVSDAEGQAVLWGAGFVVTAQDGGGGGGCAALIPPSGRGPGGLRAVLAGGWWILALAAICALNRLPKKTLGAGA